MRRPTASLTNLTAYQYFPGRPTGWQILESFEAPSDFGDYYGCRLRGYIIPPQTGDYTFWIAADEQAQLWLSADDSPVNKQLTASVMVRTAPRQWDERPSQKSAAVRLKAGQRYYVEALHKEAAGSDHLAIGWQLPGGELERPIPGARLAPFANEPQAHFDRAGHSEAGWQFVASVYSTREHVLEISSDLRTWSSIATNSGHEFTLTFQDLQTGIFPGAFYRLRQQ